jgi:hypothetical protein
MAGESIAAGMNGGGCWASFGAFRGLTEFLGGGFSGVSAG